jgi:AcrR family transcriptional regulator
VDVRRARKSAATAESIIEAAGRIVAEEGDAALTLDRVAAVADVAVQTIYNRVGGRTALLDAVSQDALRLAREYLAGQDEGAGDAAEILMRLAEAYSMFAFDHPHQWRLLAFPLPAAGSSASAQQLAVEQITVLSGILARGIDEGCIDPSIAVHSTAVALWRMWDGVLFAAVGDCTAVFDIPASAVMDAMRSVVERGTSFR